MAQHRAEGTPACILVVRHTSTTTFSCFSRHRPPFPDWRWKCAIHTTWLPDAHLATGSRHLSPRTLPQLVHFPEPALHAVSPDRGVRDAELDATIARCYDVFRVLRLPSLLISHLRTASGSRLKLCFGCLRFFFFFQPCPTPQICALLMVDELSYAILLASAEILKPLLALVMPRSVLCMW